MRGDERGGERLVGNYLLLESYSIRREWEECLPQLSPLQEKDRGGKYYFVRKLQEISRQRNLSLYSQRQPHR